MRPAAVFCTPMRLEAHTLAGGPDGLPPEAVLHTGTGPRRARQAAALPALQRADAVAVAGIAGGLAPDLRAGDVIVADQVGTVDGDCTRRLPSAPLLAAQLRRAGMRCRVGPVTSSSRPVDGRQRRRLAADGALAVDMESAWLLDRDDRPAAVLRVVMDPADSLLYSPATLGRLRSALATLRRTAPALQAWADAVGAREIRLAAPRSFCAGVERAIDVVELALEQRGAPVYVRKQIVHNRHVVGDLQHRGAVFVDHLDDVPPGGTVVFSAHGVAPHVRSQAQQRGLEVIDATCPLVAKVHQEVRRHADRGDTVVFIGHRGHEETEGTMGERPGRTVLVETVEDARTVPVDDPARVSYLVQTTLAADEVDRIVAVLRDRFPDLRDPPSDDICYATTNRQDALRAVAADADLVLVVGSQNSSNSKRLVEAAQRQDTDAHLVDDVDDVDLAWLAGARTVAVTAGASAPQSLVDNLVAALAGLGPVRTRERQTATETIRFTLPKEVRAR